MPATAVSAQLFHSLLKVASTAVVDSSGDSPGKLASLAPRAFKRNAGDFLSSAAQAPASLSSGSLSTALSQAVQQKPWTARDHSPPVFPATPSNRAIGEKTSNTRQPSPFRSCSHPPTAFPQLSSASLHSHCGQLGG
ncbi:hypothetical protein [Pseudomonas citronellolis]|uniref:hypothetical protein n=1 Tax=Pseudomonas citronellolis TaxID=53408 RepID=UPI0010671766|nr:hypothetical protein [Pseudomonas humi]